MSIAQPSHSHSINLFSLVHGYNRPPDGDDDDEEDIDATGPSTQDKIVDSLRASRRERARMLKLKCARRRGSPRRQTAGAPPGTPAGQVNVWQQDDDVRTTIVLLSPHVTSYFIPVCLQYGRRRSTPTTSKGPIALASQ